ncbi:hypothetical protein MMC29_004360 [Sticta canariensis]|nr:hypothetical protein [Sticta canariensis]
MSIRFPLWFWFFLSLAISIPPVTSSSSSPRIPAELLNGSSAAAIQGGGDIRIYYQAVDGSLHEWRSYAPNSETYMDTFLVSGNKAKADSPLAAVAGGESSSSNLGEAGRIATTPNRGSQRLTGTSLPGMKHDALLAEGDLNNVVDGADRVLNDPTLYHYDDDLLELVVVADKAERSTHVRKAKAASRPCRGISGSTSPRAAPIEKVSRLFPSDAVEAYMTMEDVDTLADENEGVLVELQSLDARRWVMRGVRVKTEEAEQTGGLSLQRAWDKDKKSDAAEPGTEHHRGGSCGNLSLWKSGVQDRPTSQI